VDIKLRIDCVESMYFPFRDVVARSNGGVRSSYYMWWHKVVIHGLDPMPRRYKYDHVTFESDQQQMVEAMFRTLSRILALDHRGEFALLIWPTLIV
jgi:hypothetical protein